MDITNRVIRMSAAAGLVVATTGVAVLTLAGGSASAKTTTLHYFSKSVSSVAYDSTGKPITNQQTLPGVGAYLIASDLDYVGNHKTHAATSTVSDNIVCTLTVSTPSSVMAVCDGAFAVGGSLLVANHVTVDLTASSPAFPITGGTGQFKGAHGKLESTSVGKTNNSDVTITLSH